MKENRSLTENIYEYLRKNIINIIQLLLTICASILFILYLKNIYNNQFKVEAEDIIYISSLLAGIWGFRKYFHTKKLEYTSAERQKWRNDLRKLVIDLQKINLEKQLNNRFIEKAEYKRVKVLSYINPIPKENSLDDKIREIFLKETVNKKDIIKQIICIQFLLKSEWEKAKKSTEFISNPLEIEECYLTKLNEELKLINNKNKENS